MLLKKGSRGKDVQTLQRVLHLLDDGIFGTLTEEAVKEFQKSHGLKVDGIVGNETWAAICGSNLIKSKRVINEIIVHCSATAEGKDFTVADITRWHKQRGFTTIGYHYVIYRDGSVHTGRDINVSGAHCTGHNSHSIGICYIGGCKSDGLSPKDTRTEAQKAALLNLLRQLRTLYPTAKIRGHRDFANKACPSFDATTEYKTI
ncbi:MAG: N-acetylmuramoyl-L-alanine amidase [Bacteroidaceae bacterium]|nr:N-acetylmuramoyl-L-alanine amidase [Bacteroidaceae bacterium]